MKVPTTGVGIRARMWVSSERVPRNPPGPSNPTGASTSPVTRRAGLPALADLSPRAPGALAANSAVRAGSSGQLDGVALADRGLNASRRRRCRRLRTRRKKGHRRQEAYSNGQMNEGGHVILREVSVSGRRTQCRASRLSGEFLSRTGKTPVAGDSGGRCSYCSGVKPEAFTAGAHSSESAFWMRPSSAAEVPVGTRPKASSRSLI